MVLFKSDARRPIVRAGLAALAHLLALRSLLLLHDAGFGRRRHTNAISTGALRPAPLPPPTGDALRNELAAAPDWRVVHCVALAHSSSPIAPYTTVASVRTRTLFSWPRSCVAAISTVASPYAAGDYLDPTEEMRMPVLPSSLTSST